MPAFALLLAPLVLLNVEDRASTRVRTFVGEDVYVDLVDTARVGLSTDDGRNSITFGYAPTVTLFSVATPSSQLTLFHNLDGSITRRYGRGVISLQTSAGIGQNNFRLNPPTLGGLTPNPTPGQPTTAPPAQIPPTDPGQTPGGAAGRGPLFDQVVWYAATSTTLSLGQMLTKRWSLGEFGGFSARGGLDDAARDMYPPQQVISSGLSAAYQLTPIDGIATTLSGSRTTTAGTATVYLAILREAWSHAFSRRSNGRLSAGIAYARQRSETAGNGTSFYPTADVGFATQLAPRPGDLAFTATVGTAPVVDWFTGAVDPRVYWNVVFSRIEGDFTVSLTANGLASITQGRLSSLAMGGLGGAFAYELTDRLFFNVAATTSWQFYTSDNASPLLISGLAGLTYTVEPLHL